MRQLTLFRTVPTCSRRSKPFDDVGRSSTTGRSRLAPGSPSRLVEDGERARGMGQHDERSPSVGCMTGRFQFVGDAAMLGGESNPG